ncbi:hypothetical protein K501DRAFT_287439 [Backusella circina FSU 941]|nr:hypothetical protein K501DRAFT_287439 [Backusella circina FSU 941]
MCRNEIRQPPLQPPHLTLRPPFDHNKAFLIETRLPIETFVETLAGANCHTRANSLERETK